MSFEYLQKGFTHLRGSLRPLEVLKARIYLHCQRLESAQKVGYEGLLPALADRKLEALSSSLRA